VSIFAGFARRQAASRLAGWRAAGAPLFSLICFFGKINSRKGHNFTASWEMKKLSWLLIGIGIIAIIGGLFVFSGFGLVDKKEIGPLPWLRVEKNQIVAESGAPIILRGVAIEDPGYTIGRGLKEKDFIELTENWNVNVIRVPIHPDLWQQNPQYTERYLDKIVSWGRKYHAYVLLGWHAHGNPVTGEVEDVEYSYPYKSNPYNPDFDLAVQFWNKTAERYKDSSWVIYSIFNEPAYMSWGEWKPIAEQLIDVVKFHNPKALVLVSGVEWGYDLHDAGKNPIQRGNVVYEVHPYPGQTAQHGPWDEYFGYLSEKYPVFAGEWGFEPNSQYENLNATSENYGEPLMEYMKNYGMSWAAWVWSPEWGPPMLKNWNYEPTEFGQLVKNELDD